MNTSFMEQIINILEINLTILARIGMLMVHVNLIPSTNVNLITIQHILSMTVTTFCYLCFGYRLTNINHLNEFLDGWIMISNDINQQIISENWKYMLLCDGLMSICLAGRAHFITSVLVSSLISSIIQPLMTNIITSGTYLNKLGKGLFEFEDSNKTSILHVFPAGFSFIASLIFGQRVVNIKNMDLSSVPINAHSTSFLGYTFIIMGFMTKNNAINNLFAISTGMMTMFIIFLFSKQDTDYWSSIWVIQGGCAAVISNVWCFKAYEVLFTAFSTTVLYATVARIMRSSILEDYCNILAIHGIAGAIPHVLTPICQIPTDVHKALVGAIFSFTIFLIGILIGAMILYPMKVLGLLRSNSEEKIYTQKWKKSNYKSTKRGIQPGEHTLMKFRKYFDTEHGPYEGRASEI